LERKIVIDVVNRIAIPVRKAINGIGLSNLYQSIHLNKQAYFGGKISKKHEVPVEELCYPQQQTDHPATPQFIR